MSVKRRTQCLLLAGALALTLTVPALAAGYSDLPESHWAYSDLMEASDLGIIQGVGNGADGPFRYHELGPVFDHAYPHLCP